MFIICMILFRSTTNKELLQINKRKHPWREMVKRSEPAQRRKYRWPVIVKKHSTSLITGTAKSHRRKTARIQMGSVLLERRTLAQPILSQTERPVADTQQPRGPLPGGHPTAQRKGRTPRLTPASQGAVTRPGTGESRVHPTGGDSRQL